MIKTSISLSSLDQCGPIHRKGKLEDMQNLNLETITRLKEPDMPLLDPVILDPTTCTLDDVVMHGITEQDLSNNTAKKRKAYLKFMENHEYPVDLRNPNKLNFSRHLRYRQFYEDPPASPDAIRHEKLAMNMLLEAYGIETWKMRMPKCRRNSKRVIPLPEIAREFWHFKYDKKRVIRKLYQYMMFQGFMIGLRCPSELANLKTTDIIFNKDGTAIITITESKKRNSQRTLVLPRFIASDPYHKSLNNWIRSWRPKLETDQSDDFLFLNPVNGKPWTHANLGRQLRKKGKMVWEHYTPYCMRHWSCVARLIDEYSRNGHWNIFTVKNWHGHEKVRSTEQYVKYAEQYYNIASYRWIQRALKRPKKTGGKHVDLAITGTRSKNHATRFSNRSNDKWARPRQNILLEGKKRVECQISHLLVFSPRSFFSFFSIFLDSHIEICCDKEMMHKRIISEGVHPNRNNLFYNPYASSLPSLHICFSSWETSNAIDFFSNYLPSPYNYFLTFPSLYINQIYQDHYLFVNFCIVSQSNRSWSGNNEKDQNTLIYFSFYYVFFCVLILLLPSNYQVVNEE
ncbi:MAG: hypothetical protein DRN27_10285 [Thermoplasmata archaeon]|nr:MAG: hypothetical protein DRN27_10285 [Thermoplasmata archaeon]